MSISQHTENLEEEIRNMKAARDNALDIASVQARVHANARSKGWYDGLPSDPTTDPHIIPARLMLIVSEVSEAMEEMRHAGSDMETLSRVDMSEPIPTQPGKRKPVGFASELADVVIRVLDLAAYLGIDMTEAIRVKMAFNETRIQRHGNKRI